MDWQHVKITCLHLVRISKNEIIFLVTLTFVVLFWKGGIVGEETCNGLVKLWGKDVSFIFHKATAHLTQIEYRLLSLLFDDIQKTDDCHIVFPNGHCIKILWMCTVIKQCFLWTLLVLVPYTVSQYRKEVLRKICFLGIGWMVIDGMNIIRLFLLSLILYYHPSLFHFFHTYAFKYLFYFFIFVLWLLFIHKRPHTIDS